jgi:hypothetical protein
MARKHLSWYCQSLLTAPQLAAATTLIRRMLTASSAEETLSAMEQIFQTHHQADRNRHAA